MWRTLSPGRHLRCIMQQTRLSRLPALAPGSSRASLLVTPANMDSHATLGASQGSAPGPACLVLPRQGPTTLRLRAFPSGFNDYRTRHVGTSRLFWTDHRKALLPEQSFRNPPPHAVQSAASGGHDGRQIRTSDPATKRPSQSPYYGSGASASGQYLRDLNDEQKAAVLSESKVIRVVAGPGTGKTSVLTSRVAHLILHHQVDPADILCVTFTNRAAKELQARLETLLQGSPHRSYRITVGTFHSISARVLRPWIESIGLLGRNADFTILDSDDSAKALKMVAGKEAEVKKEDLEAIAAERDHILRNLVQWWRQAEVAEQHEAGNAGGACRKQSAVTNGRASSADLVADSFNKLSLQKQAPSTPMGQQGPLDQMRRLLGLQPNVLSSALFAPLKADPSGGLESRVDWDKLTVDSLPSLEEVAGRLACVATILNGTSEAPRRRGVPDELRQFLESPSHKMKGVVPDHPDAALVPGLAYGPGLLLRLQGYMPAVYSENATAPEPPEYGGWLSSGNPTLAGQKAALRAATIALLHLKYEALKRKMNTIDFADMLVLAVLVARATPEFHRDPKFRFTHVLVDEFQDTDAAQYEMVRLLVGGSPDGSKAPLRSLFVVGDRDQAIYGFRRADPHFLQHQFDADYPDCETLQLSTNYRSTPQVISAANAIIRSSALPRSIGSAAPLVLTAVKPHGPAVEVFSADTCRDEAEGVASSVKRLAGRVPYRDMAVLYRMNALSRSVEKAFLANSIPFVVLGSFALLERKDSKNLLAYLKLIVNPRDSLALARVINEPPRGLGKKAMAALEGYAREKGTTLAAALHAMGTDIPDKSALPLSPRARKGLQGFLDMLAEARSWLSLAGNSPGRIVRLILHKSGYVEHLFKMKDAPESPEGPVRRGGASARHLDYDDGEQPDAEEQEQEREGRQDFHLWWEASKSLKETTAEAWERLGVVKDFLAAADAFSERPAGGKQGLQEFLENLILVGEGEGEDEQQGDAPKKSKEKLSRDAVRLLTIHAAKGLEFDTVFMIGVEDNIMPGKRNLEPEELDEEIRVCYVGMTRAQQRLYMSHTYSRFMYGDVIRAEPSQFLDVLAQHGIGAGGKIKSY